MVSKDQNCNPVCVHCGWKKASHTSDGDLALPYLPLPGALFSLLDCPGFEADTAPEVVAEEQTV